MPSFSYPSPRVSQLDARILDNELLSLLKQQLSEAFSLLSSKPWSYDSHPELWSLALKLVVFRLTTFKTGSSYGNKLQNLKLSDSARGALITRGTRVLLLGTIFGEYFLQKAQSYLYNFEENRAQIQRVFGAKISSFLARYSGTILKVSKDTYKVVELLNTVLFIIHGRFPSIVHRILGIVVTPVVADLLKFNGDKVNFEFQNRQLVWNVMTEFLVFILPLLNLRKWRKMANSMVAKKPAHGVSPSAVKTPYTDLPISQCAICVELVEKNHLKGCGSQVTNACITNCGHIFCYVCITARLNAIENGNEEAEACLRCRRKIEYFRVYGKEHGDVDPDAIIVDSPESQSEEEVNGIEVNGDGDDNGDDESNGNENENRDENEGSDSEGISDSDDSEMYEENEDLEEELSFEE